MNEKKTVSFSSTPNERTKNIISTPDCLDHMENGSDMIKMRPNGRQYKRRFFFDRESCELRWFPSNKKKNKARISVEDIREIRRGITKIGAHTVSECAFTIVYGSDFELLTLIASNAEEANVWIAGITRLISNRIMRGESDLYDDKNQTRDKWLQEVFSEADCQNKGFLDEVDVIQLMKSINSGMATLRIKQKLKEVEIQRRGDRGRLTSEEFVNVFKEISTRPEIFFLLVRYSTNGEFLTIEDFILFLEAEQGLTGISREKCIDIIQSHEPSPEGKQKGQLGIDGFTSYLLSSDCEIFDPENIKVCQDMTQPLTHYFIASSFNTYLMEDQLKGPSSINGFIRALSVGCRYIKMDCWDGANDEPIIYHGNTLTSKLSVRKVLEQIAKCAFISSTYPLIIAVENHCSVRQQYILTSLIKMTLGQYIYTHDIAELQWPSPEQLKSRILLLGKKLIDSHFTDSQGSLHNNDNSQNNVECGMVSEEDENVEFNRQKQTRTRKISSTPKIKLMKQLSDMFYFNIQRFDDSKLMENNSPLSSCLTITQKKNSSSKIWQPEISFLSELHAIRLANEHSQAFMHQNKSNLVCVYPNITRVDSSNYNPQDLWNCGCQIVALNYQSMGLMMDLNAGFFSRNGNCGYVLKPDMMRHELLLDIHHKDGIPDILPQTLHIRIISAQQLPKPRGSTAKGNVIDPYVVIQLCGTPSDCSEEKTKTVNGNAYNPVFDEPFEFEVGVTQMALVRFLVLDDDSIGDDFIGQYTIPFDCIQTGYRHVKLLNCAGEMIPNAYLFVHIAITNKRGGGKKTKRGTSVKTHYKKKYSTQIKKLGIPVLDEAFKVVNPTLKECFELRFSLLDAMNDLRDACNLPHFCNIKQCIRAMLNTVVSSCCSSPGQFPPSPSTTFFTIPTESYSSHSLTTVSNSSSPLQKCPCGTLPLSMTINAHDIPKINMSPNIDVHQLPDSLKKSLHNFEELIQVCLSVKQNCPSIQNKIEMVKKSVMEFYEILPDLCEQNDIKSRKATRLSENFVWNVRLLQGQADLTMKMNTDAADCMRNAREAGHATGILSTTNA